MTEILGEERNAVLCRELTKIHEETIKGTLGELSRYYDNDNSTEPRGEYVIVAEGASAADSAEEFTLEQAAELALQLVQGGEKLSEACRQASKATGIPKRDIYSAIMENFN